jgi:hypothetical protein
MCTGILKFCAPRHLFNVTQVFELGPSNIFSFALILWEIFTRNEPYSEFKTVADFREAICKQEIRPELKKSIPAVVQKLLKSCWATIPQERPSFVQV